MSIQTKITRKKAQSAIEFVILVGTVTFFFITFLFAIQLNISERTKENKNLALQELALSVQDEINLAMESTDGYYREFEIPEKVINTDYDISASGGFVYLRTIDGKYGISFPVTNVTGEVKKGTNVIRKEGGIICLNATLNQCSASLSPPATILTLAYFYQNEQEMLDEMEELGADVYCQGCKPKGIDEFFNNLTNYDIVLVEDPNFNQGQLDEIEDYVLNGGRVFFSENIAGGNNAFGIEHSDGGGKNPATVANSDAYLILVIGADYSLKDKSYVKEENLSEDVSNFIAIAHYANKEKIAIAKWNYGEGLVYFLADFEVVSGNNFQTEVKNAIEAIMNEG